MLSYTASRKLFCAVRNQQPYQLGWLCTPAFFRSVQSYQIPYKVTQMHTGLLYLAAYRDALFHQNLQSGQSFHVSAKVYQLSRPDTCFFFCGKHITYICDLITPLSRHKQTKRVCKWASSIIYFLAARLNCRLLSLNHAFLGWYTKACRAKKI